MTRRTLSLLIAVLVSLFVATAHPVSAKGMGQEDFAATSAPVSAVDDAANTRAHRWFMEVNITFMMTTTPDAVLYSQETTQPAGPRTRYALHADGTWTQDMMEADGMWRTIGLVLPRPETT